MLIAVNYHYIRPSFDNPYPSIFGMTPAEFQAQLERLGEVGVFVSGQQVCDAIAGKDVLPDRAILVTFDDGLREQYDFAWPVLNRMGIPALFFINTSPIADCTVSQVHKIHLLRSQVAPEDFLQMLLRHAREQEIELDFNMDGNEAASQYPYDTPQNAQLKYALNFLLPLSDRERLIERCFGEVFYEREAEISKKLYMNVEQINELNRRGCLGSHAHEHLPLGLLPAAEAEDQIRQAIRHVERWTGHRPFAMSYPYGSEDACSVEVGELAARQGIVFAFTMERAGNSSLAQSLHLARFDSNDLPGGSGAKFRLPELFSEVPSASWHR